MLGVLTRFAGELRAAGLPVSLTETIDAASAVRQLPLDDRGVLRSALAATLVKREDHRATFDLLFDVFFAGGELPVPTGEGSPEGLPAGFGLLGEDDDGSDEVEAVLLAGDVPRLAAFARRAVARHAGIEPGRPGAAAYHRFRTLRAIDLDGAFERVVARAGASVSGLQARLLADEYGVRAERVRREVDAEIRRRLAALRGAEEVAGAIRRPLPEDLDVMHAGGEELARLQGAVRPLARKLAAHLARKRRHRRGGLDFRSTVRHPLSYGGVPAEPRFRHPRPSRPEILVLADSSGSVAAFAPFTLHFHLSVSS